MTKDPWGSRNPDFEKGLKDDFRLVPFGDHWGFEGGIVFDSMASQLTTFDKCLEVLQALQKKTPFTKVCIMLGSNGQYHFICNTQPRRSDVVGKPDTSSLANRLYTHIGGSMTVMYRGLYVFNMPYNRTP